MIEINENEFELKYNTKRIDLIESVTKTPVMAAITQYGGAISRIDLVNYIAYGLKDAAEGTFLPSKQGKEMAEILIENEGYAKCLGIVLETLQEDCGFFFRDA